VLIAKLAIGVSLFVLVNLGQEQSKAQLLGTVSDMTSAPIAGALVTLSSLDRVFQTKSTAHGEFRFDNVPKGRYDLEFYSPGFVRQRIAIDVAEVPPQALTIVLKIGAIPDMSDCGPNPSVKYDALESAGPHLTGTVWAYDGHEPVANAAVSLWRTGEKRPILTSSTDKKGRFEFNDIEASRYDLRISRRGYQPAVLRQFLIPRESGVSVNFPIVKTGKIFVCQ
jgi:hypothetical protein